MYRHSVRNYDEITREFGPNLNGFLPIVEFNLRERSQPLSPSDLGSVLQFGKGYDRLKSWLNMAGLNPDYNRYRDASYFWSPVTNEMIPVKYLSDLNKLQQSFCLAALIIYFQVFGDGNHRAANYFFRLRSGRDLSVDEKNIINDIRIMFDYQRIEVLTGDHKKSIIALFDDLCRILVTRFNKLHIPRSGGSANRTSGGKGYRRTIKNTKTNKRKTHIKKKGIMRRSGRYIGPRRASGKSSARRRTLYGGVKIENVFSFNLLNPQPTPYTTMFKVITSENLDSPATWANVTQQLYDLSLYDQAYTKHIDENGDTLIEFSGVTPSAFDMYMVQIDPESGELVPISPRGVQLITRAPSIMSSEPPFPSIAQIPERFLFLIRATRRNPAEKGSPFARTSQLRPNKLYEYPGAYFSLVTEDNIRTLQPYDCGTDCYVSVFALDLLKQRNWHINFADLHGQIRSHLTFFPWQLRDIAEVVKYRTGFNEVVFHDDVPVQPFMRHLFKVNALPGTNRSDYVEQATRIGRVELQPAGLVAGLNPALPQLCWPSFFDVADAGVERDSRWVHAVADACGIDWAATMDANRDFLSKSNDMEKKTAFYAPLIAQFQRISTDRRLQNLDLIYRLSLDPTRMSGGRSKIKK